MGSARVVLAVAGGAVAVAVGAAAVASAVATARFRSAFEAEKAELLRRGRAVPPASLDPARVGTLPPPVRRYLEASGALGRPPPRVALLRQRGGLRTGPGAAWMPFEAEQAYAMEPPGFVWQARAEVAPLLHIMARDRFVDGRGRMLVRLLGWLTVADATGPEIDQGAGLRHWGEVVSFPEMVLSPQLRWEPLDDRRARLFVDQGVLRLSAVVEFGPDGFPAATHAERFRDVDGRSVLTPWTGRCLDWKVVDGRPFPSRWESIWHLPEGDFLAVKMDVLSVRVE